MSSRRRHPRRPLVLIACALTAGIATATASSAAGLAAAAGPHAPLPGSRSTFLGDKPALPDVDTRATVAPAAVVRRAVAALGSRVAVSWNQFGTPASLTVRGGGFLATGLNRRDAVGAARGWLLAHRAVFGLTAAQVRGLELVNDAHLIGSPAHAVTFRQNWGVAHAVEGGLVAVGIREGKIASVTSTLAPGIALNTRTPRLGAREAVLVAARDAGYRSLTARDVSPGAVLPGGKRRTARDRAGFTLVTATGLAGVQRARLAVLPTPTGARLVWETDVLDVADGRALATMTFVDAATGRVLVRRDAVNTLAQGSGVPQAYAIRSAAALAQPTSPTTFTTDYTDKACGKPVSLTVPVGSRSLNVAVNADNPANDILLQVLRNGQLIGSGDEATSPEVVQATFPAATSRDVFTAQVCPSPNPIGPFVAPFTATGGYNTDTESSSAPASTQQLGFPYAPTWKYFQDSPRLTTDAKPDEDVRTKACWTTDQKDPAVNKDLSDCQESVGNQASGQPWDVDARTGLPTFTTTGNNAFTADAREGSTLTPGATAYQPRSATRDYGGTFTDQWHKSGCDPTTLGPGGADQDAAITDLFTGHNIMHDFAYRLGFTERGYNLQVSNKGNTGPSQENDPEIGNVHSGAVTNVPLEALAVAGQSAPVTGRDNANQITLQDGTPGITNQYLFQPLLGFYGPCADGDLDFSIFGHEYTHAISNRMIAGPDTGVSGAQGGSMGESWSDLDALEAMHELGIAGLRGEDPESVGAYATNNTKRGIRDFALTRNPLNYGDIGFDTTGPEVHADGEIWNGVQWHVRQALIGAHPEAPAGDAALQRACATGTTRSGGALTAPASGFQGCPGNRRWIQYIYDSFLLQASGTPSFVDMKDLMLAAAVLRGSQTDADVMGTAFAQRGLGTDARSNGGADTDPVAGYTSPVAADNGEVTFTLVDAADRKAAVLGEVYLGEFQARVTPFLVARGAPVSKTMAAGTYDVLVRANGYGLQRRVLTVRAGKGNDMTITLARNLASKTNGATVTGDGVRLDNVIDDSEATDGGYDGSATSTPIAGKQITVDLGGLKKGIRRFSVSALHHPVDSKVPGDFQGRLLGLRDFTLQVSSDGGKTYVDAAPTTNGFFPAAAPRTVAPDSVLRDLVLDHPVDADHIRLVVKSNQCTGTADFNIDDNDPLNNPVCKTSANAFKVTVTELEAFADDQAGFLGGQPAEGLAALAGSNTDNGKGR